MFIGLNVFVWGFFPINSTQAHHCGETWRATTGFSPSDTFQIFSISEKLTRKPVQYLFFIILVFHVRNCVLLITDVSCVQLFGLSGCSFSCLRSIFFLPPCRNMLPCCWSASHQTGHLAARGALPRGASSSCLTLTTLLSPG